MKTYTQQQARQFQKQVLAVKNLLVKERKRFSLTIDLQTLRNIHRMEKTLERADHP